MFSWFFILNHKLKIKSLIFVSKLQIQINLLEFSCQKFKFKYIFLIFHVESQIQINFLDFFCQNCKFKSIYRILLPKLFRPTVRKNCSSDQEKLQGWRPRICKFSEIRRTIYSNSERSEQFLVTECFFNLLL